MENKFTTYVGLDGNYGSVPLILFDFDKIPAEDFDFIDGLLEDMGYTESEAWDKLIAYLKDNDIPHIVIGRKGTK